MEPNDLNHLLGNYSTLSKEFDQKKIDLDNLDTNIQTVVKAIAERVAPNKKVEIDGVMYLICQRNDTYFLRLDKVSKASKTK